MGKMSEGSSMHLLSMEMLNTVCAAANYFCNSNLEDTLSILFEIWYRPT